MPPSKTTMPGNPVFGTQQQIALYGKERVEHFKRSKAVQKYIARKATQNESTASTYKSYLMNFANFVFIKYDGIELDDFIEEIKKDKHNPYDVLAEFAAFLKNEKKGSKNGGRSISSNSINFITVTTRKFLRFSGVPVDKEDFKEYVSLPRKERAEMEALDKADVIEILNGCNGQHRLKVFLLFLAATGARAIEAASVRIADLNLEPKDGELPTVTFRSSTTKTRQTRTCYLTSELATQLKLWIKGKYEPHRTTLRRRDGSEYQDFVSPEQKPEDLVFSHWHVDGSIAEPRNIYNKTRENFADLLALIGKDKKHDGGKRLAITLHSFRRFVKTTISDQGYQDYSEWYIGHAGSTYWRKKESEKAAIFRKLEPSLTYIDAAKLAGYRADIESQLEKEREQHRREMAELEARMMLRIEAYAKAFRTQEAAEASKAAPISQERNAKKD